MNSDPFLTPVDYRIKPFANISTNKNVINGGTRRQQRKRCACNTRRRRHRRRAAK